MYANSFHEKLLCRPAFLSRSKPTKTPLTALQEHTAPVTSNKSPDRGYVLPEIGPHYLHEPFILLEAADSPSLKPTDSMDLLRNQKQSPSSRQNPNQHSISPPQKPSPQTRLSQRQQTPSSHQSPSPLNPPQNSNSASPNSAIAKPSRLNARLHKLSNRLSTRFVRPHKR